MFAFVYRPFHLQPIFIPIHSFLLASFPPPRRRRHRPLKSNLICVGETEAEMGAESQNVSLDQAERGVGQVFRPRPLVSGCFR